MVHYLRNRVGLVDPTCQFKVTGWGMYRVISATLKFSVLAHEKLVKVLTNYTAIHSYKLLINIVKPIHSLRLTFNVKTSLINTNLYIVYLNPRLGVYITFNMHW